MCESYYIIIMMFHSHSITYFSQSPLFFGHTGQHSPSGIVAPGQTTARQSTNCKDMKGFSDIHYQQSRISLASSMNVQSMHNVRK